MQGPGSSVKMEIPDGIHGFIYGHIHTSVQPFMSIIQQDRCLVAPVLEYVLSFEEPAEYPPIFKITTPHAITKKELLASVVVQRGDIHRNKPFVRHLCRYEVDEQHITIYTSTFSQFICTGCDGVCRGQARAFIFGKILQHPSLDPFTSIRLYLCSPLYNIKDYRTVCPSP